jgi:effector-binding domain-containing protein
MSLTEVRIEPGAAIPLAVIRRQVTRGELSRAVVDGCGAVWQFLRTHNLRGGRNVALYLDGSIRLEVGVEFDGALPPSGEVVASTTPAGEVVSVTHFGSYGGLGAAHAAITQWCREHGRTLAGPSWELYGHWDAAWNDDPSKIRTDVCYLVIPG